MRTSPSGSSGKKMTHVLVTDTGGRIVLHVVPAEADSDHARAEPAHVGDFRGMDPRHVGPRSGQPSAAVMEAVAPAVTVRA